MKQYNIVKNNKINGQFKTNIIFTWILDNNKRTQMVYKIGLFFIYM